MERHRSFRSFALRQTYLTTRPSTTHMDHCVSEAHVLPLQAQALRYAETRAGSQKRKRTFWVSQVSEVLGSWLRIRWLCCSGQTALGSTPGFEESNCIFWPCR